MKLIFFFLKRTLKRKVEDYQQIEFHKEIADKQRKSYNKMCKTEDYVMDNLVIDLDFKESIKIGNFLITAFPAYS